MENCIFCSIIKGDIPSEKLYEDDKVLAFKDLNAQAPEHFLVIPKEHISTPNDAMNERLLGKLNTTAVMIAKERGFSESGYRLVMNCNSDGCQSVFHIHLHCLGGRQLNWPPG
ncbi:histidine triad nucleotide-binding protein [Candidatus Thioglobus sp.]|nr:histidine triad nucleotide-binding protein [Candidatus Thioglobus sp.]